MIEILKVITPLMWLIMWVSGIIVAKGFFSTFFAVCTGGLWSLYLVLEMLYLKLGVI